VSDEALEVLGKNCPNLVSLNVSEDRKKKLITDEVRYLKRDCVTRKGQHFRT
jgi:hypothetical protein